MKRFLFWCLSLVMVFFFLSTGASRTFSDELDDLNKQIGELTTALNMSINATKPLETELNRLQAQINQIKERVAVIEQDIAIKRKNINEGYKNLAKKQEVLNHAVRDYYVKSYYNSPILTFLSADSASEITRVLTYQKRKADQDKQIITNIALLIADLEERKKKLESEQQRLTALKTSLDEQSAKLDKIVSGAKAYQATLSSKIAQLTAQQQQIIAQKLGSLNLPKSAYSMKGGCTDDRNIDPGFSPRFAMFTYGVPNRVGLNQFGAWGRAKAGQDADTILHAYYNFDGYQNVDVNINIKVNDGNGFNTGNIIWSGGLEDYIKRIYEVPDSWTDNNLAVLKAQAIAARSYVLAATDNGASSICANQYCQAFQTNPKGGNWETAVNDTPGKVMVQGGQTVKAWFSSTHGGYIFSKSPTDPYWQDRPWTKNAIDTTSGSVGSFSDLQNTAYDKDSPVFYCDWGSRASYNKTAWLKSEEMADIANVILLVRKNSSNACFVYQTDKPPPTPDPEKGCSKTDNWSADKVKQELGGESLSTVTSVEVTEVNWGSGRTTQIKINGIPFDGNEFKNYFNVRAPSNINIVGPLYNVERR